LQQIQQRHNWEQTQRELQYKQQLDQQQKQFLSGLQQQHVEEQAKSLAPRLGGDVGLAKILLSNPKLAAEYFGQMGFEQPGQQRNIQPTQSEFIQALMPTQQQQTQLPEIQQPIIQQDALTRALQATNVNQPIKQEAPIQPEKIPLTKQALQQRNAQVNNEEPWQVLSGPKPRGKIQVDLFKQAHADQKEINKEVHPFVELIDKKGGTLAKASYPIIDRLSKLVDEGNLTKARVYNQYKRWEEHAHKIGGGIGAGLGAIAGGVLGSLLPGVGTLGGAGAGAGAALHRRARR
jgi:hypothetical protein